ncbi:MAG: UbiX family flavin prenyltransferase [Candidatus Eisenbacteria bacterium]|nr:UbiX family flavin prenyltransferase [Candidatus Eisenbacteria bacterium]MCC7142135.1 UbiX family flavin prenyltransferase [Candidatus Eisenbacteria bacterium]
MRVLIGITGASGAAFGVDFVRSCPGEKYLIVSDWGRAVLQDELDLKLDALRPHVSGIFSDKDLAAPFSSGSNRYDAFVIVPCSASTMAKIAAGLADTLITRAALVALKERMRLILALRETPLSATMLENALRVTRDGAIVAPIMPPFYNRPATLEEMVHGYTQKLLGLIGAPTAAGWREESLGGTE